MKCRLPDIVMTGDGRAVTPTEFIMAIEHERTHGGLDSTTERLYALYRLERARAEYGNCYCNYCDPILYDNSHYTPPNTCESIKIIMQVKEECESLGLEMMGQ